MILALVPRDLLHQLPVPKRIRTYLDTPFYYSETIADWTVPGNEPVSINLSKEDGETLLQTFSGQPSSLSEEDHRLHPGNLETQHQTQTDTTQTYQMEEARNNPSGNVVMGNAIMPELSSATVSSTNTTTTLQNTESANEESQNPSNDDIKNNDSVQSPIISDSPSSPLVLSTHILGMWENHNLEEQEEVNSENNSVTNTCDAPPSNSNSSSPQPSSPP